MLPPASSASTTVGMSLIYEEFNPVMILAGVEDLEYGVWLQIVTN